jgi:putative IMPACT (imprinted ancient) family translation regulator
VIAHDNDDDGEHGAGAKLSALLVLMRCTDVCVVVSRWYGGIHLGPARFKYIANAARTALVDAALVVPLAKNKSK